jgi:chorismate dehydratase
MGAVRLGAVSFLNARPLVFGLDSVPRFSLRFDVPSRCAELLHADAIDVGLVPSIEYLRCTAGEYAIVPDLAVVSEGPVASVAIFTARPMADVRSIALDTSSRSSVALVSVLCRRVFGIQPRLIPHAPELGRMLASADAALVIGDQALLQAPGPVQTRPDAPPLVVEKVDLALVWKEHTGLPFVFAVWAGRAGRLQPHDVRVLQAARDLGIRNVDQIARAYYPGDEARQAVARAYLRDNIRYTLGARERAGLELFHRYALDAGVVERVEPLRFY